VVAVDPDRRLVTGPAHDPVATLAEVLTGLAAVAIEAEDIALRRPTLDEVFLSLTGRPAGDAALPAPEVRA
jgi:ABC-2 type transport system ATP-binding protein